MWNKTVVGNEFEKMNRTLSVKETLNNNLEWSLSDIFCSNVKHVSKYFVSSIPKVEPPKQAYRCIKNYLLYLKEKISRSNSCHFLNIFYNSLPVFPTIIKIQWITSVEIIWLESVALKVISWTLNFEGSVWKWKVHI